MEGPNPLMSFEGITWVLGAGQVASGPAMYHIPRRLGLPGQSENILSRFESITPLSLISTMNQK